MASPAVKKAQDGLTTQRVGKHWDDFDDLVHRLHNCPCYSTVIHTYVNLCRKLADKDNLFLAELAKRDRYFLGTIVCKRKDMRHPWIYQRVREVEKSPDGHIDLWAR